MAKPAGYFGCQWLLGPHSRSSEYASLFEPTAQIAAPHPGPIRWPVPVPSWVARPNQRRIFAPFSPCGRRAGDEGEVTISHSM